MCKSLIVVKIALCLYILVIGKGKPKAQTCSFGTRLGLNLWNVHVFSEKHELF